MTPRTKKLATEPNRTLEQRLRAEDGFSVQCAWIEPGPRDTGIAWIECLLVHAPEKPSTIVLVETFHQGGWEAFIAASTTNSVDATVAAVVDRARNP